MPPINHDLIDVASGDRLGFMSTPSLHGVIVLNKFSPCGSRLASGMGYHCLLWQLEEDVLQKVRAESHDRHHNGIG